LRIDSHHSFTERYPLDHLASILVRNRFEGSVLVGPAAWPVPDAPMVLAAIPPFDRSLMDAYLRHPKFCGVSHDLESGIPIGLEELERRGIPLDVAGGLSLIPEIARRFPALRMVIDHLGTPSSDWARHLEFAAEFPQVYCKLSRVTRLMPSPRPYVQHALAAFGPERLMFGSDWPACLPEATWKASLAAFTQAIGAQTVEIREKLLGGTAARFYGLGDNRE
jgi:L-fuconolactonase